MTGTQTTLHDSPTKARPDRPAWTAAHDAGEVAERLVADVFRAIGLLVVQARGDRVEPHDLSITGAIEVKRDRRAKLSGKIAVEVAHHNHPSGISTSTASGWVYVLDDEVLFMRTESLRQLIESRYFARVPAGEHATVVLIPVDQVRQISRSMKIGGER